MEVGTLPQVYSYTRVSSKDQNEKRQLQEFLQLGIAETNVIVEKTSGKTFNRAKYRQLLKILKPNDTLYIQSVNRLGRDYDGILEQWNKLTREMKVVVRVTSLPILNTDNPALSLTDKLIRDMTLLSQAFNAEQEWHNIKNNQAQGIAIAKKDGKHLGRPKRKLPKKFADTYARWISGEITADMAMKILRLKKTTFYRMVKEYGLKY
jgi:DNA invertase Pin-like site-specific DNA recombinase